MGIIDATDFIQMTSSRLLPNCKLIVAEVDGLSLLN